MRRMSGRSEQFGEVAAAPLLARLSTLTALLIFADILNKATNLRHKGDLDAVQVINLHNAVLHDALPPLASNESWQVAHGHDVDELWDQKDRLSSWAGHVVVLVGSDTVGHHSLGGDEVDSEVSGFNVIADSVLDGVLPALDLKLLWQLSKTREGCGNLLVDACDLIGDIIVGCLDTIRIRSEHIPDEAYLETSWCGNIHWHITCLSLRSDADQRVVGFHLCSGI